MIAFLHTTRHDRVSAGFSVPFFRHVFMVQKLRNPIRLMKPDAVLAWDMLMALFARFSESRFLDFLRKRSGHFGRLSTKGKSAIPTSTYRNCEKLRYL